MAETVPLSLYCILFFSAVFYCRSSFVKAAGVITLPLYRDDNATITSLQTANHSQLRHAQRIGSSELPDVDLSGFPATAYHVLLNFSLNGEGGKLRCLVDTGSSNLAVSANEEDGAKNHFRYTATTTLQKTFFSVTYLVSSWRAERVSDYVGLTELQNYSHFVEFGAIKSSRNFFQKHSKYDGILGAAYLGLAEPEKSPIEPYLTTLFRKTKMDPIFTTQMCVELPSPKLPATSTVTTTVSVPPTTKSESTVIYTTNVTTTKTSYNTTSTATTESLTSNPTTSTITTSTTQATSTTLTKPTTSTTTFSTASSTANDSLTAVPSSMITNTTISNSTLSKIQTTQLTTDTDSGSLSIYRRVLQSRPSGLSSNIYKSYGRMTLGGTDAKHNQTEYYYTPIFQEAFYTVIVTDIKINDESLGIACKTLNSPYFSIVDTGTTDIIVPNSVHQSIINQINRVLMLPYPTIAEAFYQGKTCLDISDVTLYRELPVIYFSMLSSQNWTESFDIRVAPWQYMRYALDESGNSCFFFSFIPMNGETGITLGISFMSGLAVVFDQKSSRVGFAKSDCVQEFMPHHPVIRPLYDLGFNASVCIPNISRKDIAESWIYVALGTASGVLFVIGVILGYFIIKWRRMKRHAFEMPPIPGVNTSTNDANAVDFDFGMEVDQDERAVIDYHN